MAALLVITLIIIIAYLLYHLATRNYDYWAKKNVPYVKPLPFFGNYAGYITLTQYYPEICQKMCRKFPDAPYFGTFYGTQPALVIKDPEIIKLVFTKDFYYFNSRELMDFTDREVITQNMFFSYGDRWKIVRQNLTPLFSAARMKSMFYLIEKCAFMFEDMLEYEGSMSDILDARVLMIRYTMDCICSCAFGIEANTQARDSKDNQFTKMGKAIFGTSYLRGLLVVARMMWPKTFYGIGLKIFPSFISKFFDKLVTEVFVSRQYKPSPRNDFVDLILGFKNNNCLVGDSMSNLKTGDSKKTTLKVDDELLISQCALFFAVGFETSASFLSLTLYELAKDQESQARAHKEVDEYLKRHNNKLSYECVNELPFLDACISESIRLYAILGILTREAVEDYTFPSGLKVEKGMRIHLPVHHIHRDPENFPEPDEFRPGRFLPEARHLIKPYTYFPFGEGPRTCIGMRFSKMQVLPGLITFLKKYHMELAPGTPRKLKFQTTSLVMQPNCPLGVKVTPREGWGSRVYAQ